MWLEKVAEELDVPVDEAWEWVPHTDEDLSGLDKLVDFGSLITALLAKEVEKRTGISVWPIFAEDSTLMEDNTILLLAELDGLKVAILHYWFKAWHVYFKTREEFEKWMDSLLNEALENLEKAKERVGVGS